MIAETLGLVFSFPYLELEVVKHIPVECSAQRAGDSQLAFENAVLKRVSLKLQILSMEHDELSTGDSRARVFQRKTRASEF